ncbi:thymidine phosphorylase [Candidatus Neomarinimicrobiota bacterium]
MIPYDLIRKKQQGREHSPAELRFLVDAFTDSTLPDYQMAAWLMAVHFQGMTVDERHELVRLMIDSGKRLDFSHLDGYVADKHSTGGVGDKVSLILGPVVAACGIYVPMLSGRGLGHTGGTLDKLDAIPGFRTNLDLDSFQQQVADIGLCIMGQTDDICPADRKMYALRDVTATVVSVPLICGSIMSKKIAEGIQGLVLDIKCGSGAFMTTLEDARELSAALRETGAEFDVHTIARITDMNQPLGRAAGVWCEVQESLDVLEGNGPADLLTVTKVLSTDILRLAGAEDPEHQVDEVLQSGRAREKLDQMVAAQGGDIRSLTDATVYQPQSTVLLTAPADGYLAAVESYEVGMALVTAGAGRIQQTDALDPSAGLSLDIKVGDEVRSGDEIGRVFGSDGERVNEAAGEIQAALHWSEAEVDPLPLILE